MDNSPLETSSLDDSCFLPRQGSEKPLLILKLRVPIFAQHTWSVGRAKCICGLALFVSGGKPVPTTVDDDDDDDDDDAEEDDDDDEDEEEYGLSRL